MTLALARRYRPQTFTQVVGQDTTLCALSNALDTKRLHHAYLFTGTRGVGKTSLARILAKCLNCSKGVTSQPCGTCTNCTDIVQGSFVDLIEVDAASRTKVEDTRELLDNVQYAPTQGRYKVYLIDEVHMLSGHSFNALLKTLEEPPAHVVFILATTDPHKIPATILSRCMQFHLWHVTEPDITQHLKKVLNQENASCEEGALSIIARAANGSLRDALSLLDQALAYGNGSVEVKSVQSMLGLSAEEQLHTLIRAVIQGDAARVLEMVNDASKRIPDFSGLLNQILELLYHISLAQSAPTALDPSMNSYEVLMRFAQEATFEEIQLYYEIGISGQKDLSYAPNPKIGLEMILLRMVAFQPVKIGHPRMVQQKAVEVQKTVEVTVEAKKEMAVEVEKTPEPTSVPAVAETGADLSNWAEVISKLNITGLTKILAEHCIVGKQEGDLVLLILDVTKNMLLNKRNQDRLEQALITYLNRKIILKISNGKTDQETPAVQNSRVEQERNTAAREKVDSDKGIQNLIKTFGATVEDISIDRS